MLSAAGLRQQDFRQSGDLLRRRVPEEQAGFEHFQLNDTPAVVRVSKEVNPRVGPAARGSGHGPLGDVQDLWRGCPWLVFGAKVILDPVVPGDRNLLHAMGRFPAPIQQGIFAFDHDGGAKRLQQDLVKVLKQGFRVLAGLR